MLCRGSIVAVDHVANKDGSRCPKMVLYVLETCLYRYNQSRIHFNALLEEKVGQLVVTVPYRTAWSCVCNNVPFNLSTYYGLINNAPAGRR